jgi:mitochondrial import inner membrane translocase subunit TIM23
MKQGAATANTLGTLSVMYSVFGVILQYSRGEDDEINTVVAGGATGLLYKSTSGLRRCALGGGVGLALSTLYVLWSIGSGGSNKKLTDFRQQYL